MGEFKLHRVRFFDYMPSAIRSLAYDPHGERIALVRADGSVEIFNQADNFFQEKVCVTRNQFQFGSRPRRKLCNIYFMFAGHPWSRSVLH